MYSGEEIRLCIETCANVVHYHRDLRTIFLTAGVPQHLLDSVPERADGLTPSKRDVAYHVVTGLVSMGEEGIGPLRQIVRQLTDWRNFAPAADPERAKALVRQLRAQVGVQTEIRDTQREAAARRQASFKEATRTQAAYQAELERLHCEFLQLTRCEDRQQRGYRFQKLLYELFKISEMHPREAFRIVGEEIDGTFILDQADFLMEARWRQAPTDAGELFKFRGKVEGKLEGTRGFFISVNGFSSDAVAAFLKGQRPSIVLIDGSDISFVLEGRIRFDELLREKRKIAAAEGEIYVPATKLLC